MLLRKPTATLRLGLVFLILSNVFGYFAPRTHLVTERWVDGIRGLLLGLTIGLLLLSLRARKTGTGSTG